MDAVEKQATKSTLAIIQNKKQGLKTLQDLLDAASNLKDGSEAQRTILEELSKRCEGEAKVEFSMRRDPALGKYTRGLLIGIAITLGVLGIGLGLLVAMRISKSVTGRYAFWETTGEVALEKMEDTLREVNIKPPPGP